MTAEASATEESAGTSAAAMTDGPPAARLRVAGAPSVIAAALVPADSSVALASAVTGRRPR